MPDSAAAADDDDEELLREYCATRAEGAFRGLVERHLPAVWSTAKRIVKGDGALAEDITQEVFAHLAVYAPRLPARVVLGGWLHRHTCFTAAKALRTAARRTARELQHAAAMNAAAITAPDSWPDLAPRLDAALNSLPAADRDAVVLRFFEKRDFRSIAVVLGTSEDAARMKTARAVEKLRGKLGKRSALLTVALLTSLLADKSVAAPPGGLAGSVVHGSLAKAAAVPAASGLSLFLARLRPRRAALAGGAVLVLLGGFAVWQWTDLLRGGEQAPAAGAVIPKKIEAALVATGNIPRFRQGELALHFLYVPEAKAAAILDARWNGDDDTALLKSLLEEAGKQSGGVQLAGMLEGRCVGGQRVKLEKTKEFSYPVSFISPGEDGEMRVAEKMVRHYGTKADVEMSIDVDGQHCDVNLALEHDYAEPEMHRFSTSLTDPENKALPGVDQPAFRSTKVMTQIILTPGESGLAHSSRLPALPGVAPRRLFVFCTIQSVTQP